MAPTVLLLLLGTVSVSASSVIQASGAKQQRVLSPEFQALIDTCELALAEYQKSIEMVPKDLWVSALQRNDREAMGLINVVEVDIMQAKIYADLIKGEQVKLRQHKYPDTSFNRKSLYRSLHAKIDQLSNVLQRIDKFVEDWRKTNVNSSVNTDDKIEPNTNVDTNIKPNTNSNIKPNTNFAAKYCLKCIKVSAAITGLAALGALIGKAIGASFDDGQDHGDNTGGSLTSQVTSSWKMGPTVGVTTLEPSAFGPIIIIGGIVLIVIVIALVYFLVYKRASSSGHDPETGKSAQDSSSGPSSIDDSKVNKSKTEKSKAYSNKRGQSSSSGAKDTSPTGTSMTALSGRTQGSKGV